MTDRKSTPKRSSNRSRSGCLTPDKSDYRTCSGLVLHLSGLRVNQDLAQANHIRAILCLYKAQVANNSPTTSITWTRWLILIGICSTAVGILSDFRLERHISDSEFNFLYRSYLPAFLLGLAATLIGSVLWARRAAINNVALWGLGILICGPLALSRLPINIHGWTANFLFVGFDAILIGGLFLIVAAVRAFKIHRGGVTPD
jgi:hypothetical protein